MSSCILSNCGADCISQFVHFALSPSVMLKFAIDSQDARHVNDNLVSPYLSQPRRSYEEVLLDRLAREKE